MQVSSYHYYLLLSINVQSASLKHNMKKVWFFNNERGLVERGGINNKS